MCLNAELHEHFNKLINFDFAAFFLLPHIFLMALGSLQFIETMPWALKG